MKIPTFLIIAVISVTAANNSFEGYKVYKLTPTTEKVNHFLLALQYNNEFDFWSEVNKVGNPVILMASPKVQKYFEKYLLQNKIDYNIQIEDVQRTIDTERKYNQQILPRAGISFEQYLSHDEINNYLDELAQSYPDLVTVSTIGQSYENRSVNLVRISSNASANNPAIFIDAGIHAREWIAPAVALYLINQLVENADNRNLTSDVDWIVLPSLNPDGYEYSRNNDRLWRKTRSPGLICDGADANRNLDFHWLEIGASAFECDQTYAGSAPFSEVETRNVRDYLLNNGNISAYLTLHSYGQYLLYPYGHTSDLPENADELQELGERVKAAISAVSGTQYTVGSSNRVLYATTGSTQDWAFAVAGINISYTIELPGGGWFGFDIPPTEILKVGIETFEGFKVVHNYVRQNYIKA